MSKGLFSRIAFSIGAVFLLVGCYGGSGEGGKLVGSFRVSFSPGTKTGAPEKPLKVARNFVKYTLNIEPLDAAGNLEGNYRGKVCVYTNRGILKASLFPIELKGKSQIQVQLKLGFGRTVIWVGEIKSGERCPNSLDPNDTVLPGVGRVGAAPPLYFELLSIRDVQFSQLKPYDSPLYKKYSIIGRGKMVVTAVTSNGFYITDLEAAKDGKGYDSIFIFTFSAPTLIFGEGATQKLLSPGDLIVRVEGGIDEFSGHTQLTFPTFIPKWRDKAAGRTEKLPLSQLPPPRKIQPDLFWSREDMEPYESSLVQIEDAIAVPVVRDQDGWSEFRQWPVVLVYSDSGADRAKCEKLVFRELGLPLNGKSLGKSQYRACLSRCRDERVKREKKCSYSDEKCRSQARDSWFRCFFDCRCSSGHPACSKEGLFPKLKAQGCGYSVVLVITNDTMPLFDPLAPEHASRRFTYIRGILKQVRASSFYKLTPDQYPDEMSNAGFVLWVRGEEDLKFQKSR